MHRSMSWAGRETNAFLKEAKEDSEREHGREAVLIPGHLYSVLRRVHMKVDDLKMNSLKFRQPCVPLGEFLCTPRFEDWCPAAFWEVNAGLQTEPKSSPMMDPNICGWWGATTGCPCPSHSGPASHLTMSGTWAVAREWGVPWENLLLLWEWSFWSLGVGSVILGWVKWEAFGLVCLWDLYIQLNINPRAFLILCSMT